MKKCLIFCFCLLLLSLVTNADAHQPRFVTNQSTSEINPIIIENPEVSKAFYGQIKKSNEYYVIDSTKDFVLYISLEVPDIPFQSKNIVLDLKNNF